MSEQLVPEIRVAGFDGAWTRGDFGNAVSYLRNNSMSRAQLTSFDTGIKNVHYGDLLVRYGTVLNVTTERMPFVADPSGQQLGDRLSEGDVVFADAAEDATVGKCCEVRNLGHDAVVPGLHTIAARPTDEFGPGFLGYSLNSPAFHDQLLSLMQGSKVSSISRSSLNGCTITYPTKSEQAGIGSVMMSVDRTLRQHEQKHRQLQQARASLMLRMFPAPGASLPEIRFEGFAGAWTQNPLGDLGRAVAGFGFPNVEQGGRVGTPFYKVSDMNLPGNSRRMAAANNYVRPDQIVRLSWKAVSDVPAIIFAKVGAAVFLGRKRIADHPFLIDNNMMAFCINGQLLDAAFAQALFETVNLSSLVQVGALPSFNPPALESLSVWVPETFAEQRVIGAFFSKLDDLIEAEAKYVSKLQQVKAALLQKMFL